MKLGIIGSGGIVQAFLPNLTKLEGLEIKGIQSTPRSLEANKELCAKYAIPLATADPEELFASDIDTVYVATPNFLHYDNVMNALEHGKNVIVEKPMTSNEKEARALAAKAKEKNLFLFEAITTHYLDNYQKIKEWMERIGDVRIAEAKYCQYSRRFDAFMAGEVLPAFDPAKSGGALMDINLYNIHFITGLFGKPESVHYCANIERGIDTSGILYLQYDKTQAVCIGAKDCEGESHAAIHGTKGTITTQLPAGLIGKVTLRMHDGTVEEYDDGMTVQREVQEFKAFIKAINSGDHAFADQMLAQSVLVSEVQTAARKDAGIHFKADE